MLMKDRDVSLSTSHPCKEKRMPELSRIDPRSTALLVMDYQVDALTKFMTAVQSADAIACVRSEERRVGKEC